MTYFLNIPKNPFTRSDRFSKRKVVSSLPTIMAWQCVQNRKMHWCFCNTIGNSLYHLNAGYQIPALSNLAPYFFQTCLMITLLVAHYAFQLQFAAFEGGPPWKNRLQDPASTHRPYEILDPPPSILWFYCICFTASYVVFAPPLPLPLLWGGQFFWQRHQTASEQSVPPLQQPCKMQGLPPALVPASQVWTWVPGTQRLCCWTSGCKQD